MWIVIYKLYAEYIIEYKPIYIVIADRMFDSKVKEKKRKKINSLVQQRMNETDTKDEKLVRQEIMRELRKKGKEKKNEELEVVKKQVRDQLGW